MTCSLGIVLIAAEKLSKLEVGLIVGGIIGGVVLLIGLLIYVAVKMEQKRTLALEAAARESGFQFQPKEDPDLLARLGAFTLFSQGHGRLQKNVLTKRTDNLQTAVFDYQYTTGSGKTQHQAQQTVIAFTFQGAALPAFSLCPEGFWSKIGSLVGFQDIDFDAYPDFSKKYWLKGTDEQAIRQVFPDNVLHYYEGLSGVSTEASGQTLLYYRAGKRVKPPQLQEFLQEGLGVLAQFLKGMAPPAVR